MRVFLTGPEDASVDGGDRWREYVTTYVMRLPTEWVPPGPVDEDGERAAPSPFLKRWAPSFLMGANGADRLFFFFPPCRTRRTEDGRAIVVDDAMSVRIQRPAYKLVYEAGAEDFIWWPRGRTGTWETRMRAAAERRKACLAERYS
jgi:paired amphipathic helix protein Sin3a